jgi:PAS domain S-box-containing protein
MPVEINQTVQQKTHPNISSQDTILTIIFGAAAAFLGTIGIVGLFFDIVFFSAVQPGFKPIGVSAALAWIFFGLVLAIHAKKPPTGARLTVVTAFLVVIAMTAAMDIPLRLMGKSFLLEDLVNSIASRIMSGEITPVSPIAAFFLLLSAVGLFVLLHASRDLPDRQKARDITGIAGFFIAFMSFTVLLSYGLGAPLLYKTTIIPIAFTSALASLFTGLGLITSAGSFSLPLRYLTGPGVRSRLLRSFLPLIVIIVLTQGLLQSTLISVWHIDNVIEIAIGLMLFCLITIFVVSKVAGEVSQLIESEEEKRRKAEGLLHESEETFRALAENANDGILVAVSTGLHVFANRRAAEITGYSVDELMKLGIKDLAHPDEYTKRLKERYTRILTGQPVQLQYETTIVRKDGENVLIEVTSAKTDWKGQSGDLVIIRDITERKRAEEQILNQYAVMKGVMESTNSAVFSLDRNYRYTSFNSHHAAIMKLLYGAEIQLDRSIFDYQSVEVDSATARKNIDRAFAGEQFTDAAYSGDDEGSRRYFEVTHNPIRDANGVVVGVAVFAQDTTERELARKMLHESAEYLNNLLDYANAPIIVWDPAFRITRFNHAFEHLTGRSEAEVVGKHLAILFPETSRNSSFELIRKTLFGERWEVVEIPIRHVSGETRIVLWNSANIVDPQGTLISTIAQGQDITERKLAEEALKKNEHKFQTLADFTYDWAYWIDTDLHMVYTSPSCERITGYSPEDFMGNPDLMVTIVYPDDRDIYLKHRSDMHYKPAAGMLEFRILHHDGSVRWLGHVCRPIFDSDGQFLGTRVSNRDITEQKAMQRQREALIRELEQKNAELERFTYTVSHDLKSPLITIKGFAGLLEDDALKSDPLQLKKDVERITVAADTMQELLTDVLELSRIGRIISPLENTPFGVIVQEAVNLLSLQLAERHVTVSIAPDLPAVKVDHARIREVMVNLIENAIKFFGDRPDPEIRIGVNTREKTPVFFVQDNGIGIEPKYLERIFNLFEKLNVSAQGTGVGLAIVRRIIDFHGGKIWAESEGAGKGTTFRFTLPAPAEGDNHL